MFIGKQKEGGEELRQEMKRLAAGRERHSRRNSHNEYQLSCL
jgi:hypothetical protein